MLRGILAGRAGLARRSPLAQVLPLLAAFVPGRLAPLPSAGLRLGSGLSGAAAALPPRPPAELAAAAAAAGAPQAFLSERRWAEVQAQLSPPLYRALRETFGFERLAKVQGATLELLLRGEDVFAKAKTGGGKTLGFLVPALDRLLKAGGSGGGGGGGGRGRIGALIISPTRELALQILEEARTLATFVPALRVDCSIGGTNINGERGRYSRGGVPVVDILVATPGRCVDHIKTSPGFAQALGAARVLVLDEADRLLDMGFERDITLIQSHLPPPAPPPAPSGAPRAAGRQTMLFSATVPEAVKSVAHRLLRVGYPMVDTVGKEDTATNPQVTQEVMVRGPRRREGAQAMHWPCVWLLPGPSTHSPLSLSLHFFPAPPLLHSPGAAAGLSAACAGARAGAHCWRQPPAQDCGVFPHGARHGLPRQPV
jgi:hypothetical protein